MCEGPHGVKHSVEKEWCTLCDEAGCDDVYDVRGRCDEAGAHHRDTAHIFTRAEPETAAGHQRVDQSFQTLKAYVFTTVSFPRHPCLVINPRLVLSSHQ